MNWFFKVMFIGTTCSAVLVEKVISSKSIFLPKLEVIEEVFKRSFQNSPHTESLENVRTRSAIAKRMEMPQDDLSYLQHGYHPGNEEVWKMYRVWKAMNNVARHLPQILFSHKESRTKTVIRELCERNAREHIGIDFEEIQCDPDQEYRSFNGTCNNLINTRWGSAAQPFERFLPADYGDGVSGLRRSANDLELPNPRVISRALSASTAREQPKVSLMLMQWGQFLDHDITRTPELELEEAVDGSKACVCCSEGKLSNSESLWDDCVPIDVTGDDYYQMDPDGRECIRFVRSMPTTKGCDVTIREQMNSITAFVDGSMIYGEDVKIADSLRTKSHGLLNTTTHENGQPLPPKGSNQTDSEVHMCPVPESMNSCFLAGDVRVDEIPGLTALHTTFIRLHNIIAGDLAQVNPHWNNDDERLYQETRSIVIALIQQTTYRDWLPHVVGPTLMDELQLDTATQGYRDTYNESVNPSIRNVFATAAFRFGHSLIAESIKAAIPANDQPVSGHFFDPSVINSRSTSPSSLLKGLTRCPAQPIDPVVERTFTETLFAREPAADGNFYGLDLVSLNIQRGRDHGIPSYREWRRFCGLNDLKDFEGLKEVMPDDIVHAFRQTYQHIDDVDLFPAGLAESAIADGILGPTFSCIISQQFANTKHGDRFWYEREDQLKPFTPEQLNSIRSQTLSSILCRVSEHTTFDFQPDPFLVEDQYLNAVRSCSSYSFINLQPWKEQEKVLPPCPEGLFRAGNSQQCFIFFMDTQRSWNDAKHKCEDEGYSMAEPREPLIVRSYIVETYDPYWSTWLGAQGDGSSLRWLRSGEAISNNDPFWRSGDPGAKVTPNHKLVLGTSGFHLSHYTNTPFKSYPGERKRNTLCELVAPCPEGLFRAGNSQQCFIFFMDTQRSWNDAKQKCEDEGYSMAEPREPLAVRSYIVDTYDPYWSTWLGAQGDGSSLRWLRSGEAISNNDPFWRSGDPGTKVTPNHKLVLGTSGWHLSHYTNTPFKSYPGEYTRNTLCESHRGCPEGFFKSKDSEPCYYFFHDNRRTWSNAKSKCEEYQLTLAEPQDPVALTSYLTTTYGLVYWTWLGARGNGNTMVWQSSGNLLSNNSQYWRPGKPGGVEYKNCVVLQTAPYGQEHYPNNPYTTVFCDSNRQWTLCELPN